MFLRDLIAVAEHFGDERGGNFLHERAEGCVPCAQEVDAQFPETLHERVRVDVSAGPVSGEQPLAARTAAGTHVGASSQMFYENRRERLRDG